MGMIKHSSDRKPTPRITDIIATNPVGSRIEITLKEGVEFNDDRGPAGANDPSGFQMTTETKHSAGIRVTGYVVRYDMQEWYNRVFLRPTNEPASKIPTFPSFYVMEAAIFDYKKD